MATGRPVTKKLIKYNSNRLEENDEEGANWYWVYWAKCLFWNNENTIGFWWSGVQNEDEEENTLANLIENYKSK